MKKGFTLVELLAVIAVIGILALITAPLMIGVLKNSERDAFEDSIHGIISAVNLDKAEDNFNINRVYNITAGTITPTLQTEGSINGNGIVKLDEDGNIYLSIQFKTWCATKDYDTTTIRIREESCITNSDTAGVNSPLLYSALVPIKWDGAKWIKADTRNPSGATQWYNYATKMWANAVLVRETGTRTRDYYLSDAAIGTEVYTADILAYFVWIPRYRYAIPAGAGARAINISFEVGVPEKAVGDAVGTNYLTHPAFTFGDRELTGFWMSKFEVTGNTTDMTVLPGVPALVNTGFANVYSKVTTSNQNGNVYGLSFAKSNLRLVKNSEWGAVAYLTNSIYGKNATLYRNPSSTFVTGCAGTTATAAASAGCSYLYTTTNGVHSSTTDSVYGVYGMSGGANEIVMGNYKEYSALSGIAMFPEDKYFNYYMTPTASTACSGTICYGHGLSETSAWYSGTATFINATTPWLLRGGSSSGTIASQFSFNQSSGAATSDVGYRLSLSSK